MTTAAPVVIAALSSDSKYAPPVNQTVRSVLVHTPNSMSAGKLAPSGYSATAAAFCAPATLPRRLARRRPQ